MRVLVVIALLGACSREQAPQKKEGGSYRELVASTQSGSAAEPRRTLACTQAFVELSKQPRREVAVASDGRCQQGDFEAQLRCMDQREAQLGALSGDALWRVADDGELVTAVFRRLIDVREAGATLAAPEQELVAVYMLDAEVRNGGFHQFFYNSSGDLALAARDALRRFAMPQVLALLDCAMTAFPKNQPNADRSARIEELARWGDRQFDVFEVVTGAYYVVADEEWLRVDNYIRAHRGEFPNAQQGRN